MAYWFVMQSGSYDVERPGGFLWAPQYGTRNGSRFDPLYWKNMERVRAGDVHLLTREAEPKSDRRR